MQIDAHPDPAYHFDADPDPAYHFVAGPDSDPAFQFDADPQQWSFVLGGGGRLAPSFVSITTSLLLIDGAHGTEVISLPVLLTEIYSAQQPGHSCQVRSSDNLFLLSVCSALDPYSFDTDPDLAF
jgi:hypothetical protein